MWICSLEVTALVQILTPSFLAELPWPCDLTILTLYCHCKHTNSIYYHYYNVPSRTWCIIWRHLDMFVPIYLVREKSCTLKFSNVTMVNTLLTSFVPLNCFLLWDLSLIYLVWFTLRGLPLEVGFPGSSDGKESACNAGDPGLISGSEMSPGEENGCLLQYSCLENPVDWGAWWATVHGVTKNRTWLNDFHFTLRGDVFEC